MRLLATFDKLNLCHQFLNAINLLVKRMIDFFTYSSLYDIERIFVQFSTLNE